MKITVHTIISVCCADAGATEMNVLGTFVDENKARECFEAQKQKEIAYTKQNGWEVYQDEDEFYYEAGEDGNFNNNFGMLYWHRKEFEI